MPRIAYTPKTFTASHREIIDAANLIVDEYAAQGFDLTLRQLYYQFVARDLLPNQQKEYKRLGGIVNDARLAGELDWDAIVDRTRGLRRSYQSHGAGPVEHEGHDDRHERLQQLQQRGHHQAARHAEGHRREGRGL